MKYFAISLWLFFCGISSAVATPLTAHSVENTTEDHTIPIHTTEMQTTAQASTDSENTWGLTAEAWSRYQRYMQGSDGLWYRQLTPAAVLGMHADTAAEQAQYAEIVAREEHDRIMRELAFDQAVNNALHRLYANEPLIKPFDVTPFNPQNRKVP